jgi:hypothetical protein
VRDHQSQLACTMHRTARLMGAVGAGLWGVEAARYNADLACVYTLAGLPTPLGGEVAELIRARDPAHRALLCARHPHVLQCCLDPCISIAHLLMK